MLKRLILPELGDAKLVALTPAQIRTWHTALGTEHPTRNAHAYALLHAICTTAVQDEVLDANPCRIRAAMQTKRRREVDILTPAQVDKLAPKMPATLGASVVLAAWCGLRWGETSELRRKDVSDDCSLLRIRRAVTYRAGKFYPASPRPPPASVTWQCPPHIRPVLKAHLDETRLARPRIRCCSPTKTAPIYAPIATDTGSLPARPSESRTCGSMTSAMSAPCSRLNPAPPQRN